jgi:hypothetical protein
MNYCSKDNKELLSSYFLDACTSQEMVFLGEHLKECQSCQKQIEEWIPVREELLNQVSPISVPSSLKNRLMAQVNQEAAMIASASERAKKPSQNNARLKSRWQSLFNHGSRFTLWTPVATITTGLTVLALFLFGVLGGSASGGHILSTHGSALAPTSLATLNLNSHSKVLDLSGMPSAGTGRVYELWTQKQNGPPRPAGKLFEVNGVGRANVALPHNGKGYTNILITSEPLHGSGHPTRPITIQMQI